MDLISKLVMKSTLIISLMISVSSLGTIYGQDVTLSFPELLTGEPGESFTLDVTANDLTGLDIFNFGVEMAYDRSLLTVETQGVAGGEMLNGLLTPNVTDDGRILIGYAGSQPLSGEGTLFTVTGTFQQEGQNAQGVQINELTVGDGTLDVSPAVPFDIAVDVAVDPVPISWELTPASQTLDSPSGGSVDLTIDQTAGTDALTWSVSTDAGWLTVDGASTGSGDAVVSLTAGENSSESPREATVTVSSNAGQKSATVIQPGAPPAGEVALDFGDPVTGQVGDAFSVPVTVSDLSGLGVTNFDMEFTYDTALLSVETGGITGGEMLNGLLTPNVTDDGRILISYASSSELSGAGTLFTISGVLAAEGQNPSGVTVSDIMMGDGTLDVSPAVPFDIAVSIDSVVEPGIVQLESPADGSEVTGPDVTLRWQAEDLANRYKVEVATDASFNDIFFSDTSVQTAFVELQGLEAGTTYSWRVRAFNEASGYVDWSEVWSFTTTSESVAIEWTLSPQEITLPDASAATVDLTIDQTAGTDALTWSVSTDAGWLTVDGASTGSGDAVVSLTAGENSSESPREATVTVSSNAGQKTATVTQPGVSAPGVAQLESPSDGSEVTGPDVTLRWQAEDLANRYKVDVATDASFNDIFFSDTSVQTAFVELQGLEEDQVYYWRVRSFNEASGYVDWSAVWSFNTEVVVSTDKFDRVLSFNLAQNYPNPFNPTTQIQYSIPEQAHVSLEVFSMLGERVALLVDDMKSPGIYNVNFDASNLSSGTYLYRINAGDFIKTEKMILIK